LDATGFDLREVIIFLAVAGLVVPIMHRLRISPVLGFLSVGLALGPHGLGRLAPEVPWLRLFVIDDPAGIRPLAELGVVFLLFTIGLELSLDRLLTMSRLVFGLGGVQVVVTAGVIAAIGGLFGNPLTVAVILGACLALSSTAIVMQLLTEARRLGSRVGRVCLAVLLAQDLAVVPILFLVGALGSQSQDGVAVPLLLALAKAVAAIVAIMVIGRQVVRPLFALVSATRSRELFMAAVLLVIIGAAVTTQALGLSLALGAFLAGLLLAETEHRHEIEADVGPFKGLLLALFFISIGMSVDLAVALDAPALVGLSLVGLFAVKAIILFGLVRAFGEDNATAAEASLLLGQGGEFAFVVVSLAMSVGALAGDTAQFMLIVTSLSMFATPVVAAAARRLSRGIAARARVAVSPDVAPDLTSHVIIAGYGRVGRTIGEMLEAQAIPHVGLDLDPAAVARFRSGGAAVFVGDATRADILRGIGVETAAVLVVTMDDAAAAERVVFAAHRLWPALAIIARARDSRHARRLLAVGATEVVPETVEASLELAEVVLGAAGVPAEAARQLVEQRRAEVRATIRGQARAIDPE